MSTLLIKNAQLIVTMDDSQRIIDNGDIYIEGEKIVQIGKKLIHEAETIIEADGKLVLPGFINTHHHLYQTLCRSIPAVQNSQLFHWLTTLYQLWKHINHEWVYISALVGLGELLLTGCTTCADHFYVFPRNRSHNLLEETIKAAQLLGIRFYPTRGSMSLGRSRGGLPPDEIVQEEEEIIKDCIRLIDSYHDPSPFSMCRIGLAPCSPFSVTPQLLKKTVELARTRGLRCHTHLAETLDEEKYCLRVYNKRPLELMRDCNWLGEDIWFAHGIYFNEQELEILAQTHTGIAHCPSSNCRLGSGIAPLPVWLNKNIPVGLAVDGSASNDTSDMWGELRTCLLLHRARWGVDSIKPAEVIKLATRGGADILGWPEIGSIEEGKAADIILLDLKKIGYAGSVFDPLASIILCGNSHIVDTSIVNGRVVVEKGKLLNINEEELVEQANQLTKMLLERYI